MKSTGRRNSDRSSRFPLFCLFTCFANNRMTRRGLGMEAFGTSRRFSAWLRRSCWSAQLRQKARHGPANLRQGQDRAARLPGSIDASNQRASEDQLVMRASDDLCPAFCLLWGVQTRLIPEQHLFIQSVAVLVRVTQAIGRADLGQGSGLVSFPDKPTHRSDHADVRLLHDG